MMTRVWPNQTIQLPTMIVMIQMLKGEIRWIYLDGRPHEDPDVKAASYAGRFDRSLGGRYARRRN